MKKVFLLFFTLFLFSVVLGGCQREVGTSTQTDETDQKIGDSVFHGTVFTQGDRFYLKNITEKPQDTIEIDSYSVDLSSFVNKSVTITGQYSGDTLFVAKIAE